ncbi:hypothetical protein NADFUDRAFT_46844 [Nadsonia fulvescens var. elongata DSM 6958]|uniref:Uncharacterized protein n=1 Tax=Nadsonia fulvescens var. elongata DSM 6958 TaxID=857566 RepID=A0A1E3PI35_9ASCO|nr:hypothetical protein NADFUDRAFT_46844 [Nadsonia fulvescens var. elongata DSM 6958]
MQFLTTITSLLLAGSALASTASTQATFTYTKSSELIKTTSLPHMVIYETIQKVEVIQTVPGSGDKASIVIATATSDYSILPLALPSHATTMAVIPTVTAI